jgi:hypothetical protein
VPAAENAKQSEFQQETKQQVSSQLVRSFFEKLQKGECEEIISMVNSYGLDVSSVRNDAANFLQTPLFEACAIKDEEKALRLV